MAAMTGVIGGLVGWLKRHRPELRLSLRTVVAGLLAFAIAELLALPQGYWSVFTAVLVVQASLGGSLKATIDRLLGTLGGAVCAAIVSSFIPHSESLALGLALAVVLAPLALLAALRPSFRVAPITGVIILLGSTNAQMRPLTSAIDRVIEITIGCLVGLAVSLLVLPARAHGLVAGAAARTLGLLSAMLATLLEGAGKPLDPVAVQRLNDDIRARFTTLEAAAEEARRERRSHLTDAADPVPLLRTLRRVRHDLVMIGRAVAQPLAPAAAGRLGPPLAALSAVAVGFLHGVAEALSARRLPPSFDGVTAAFEVYVTAMTVLRQERATQDLSVEDAGRVFALGFALDQLREDFADLHNRAKEFVPGAQKP
jgi:uncharacterized membrane protein YccC